jgi:hypothetical protein
MTVAATTLELGPNALTFALALPSILGAVAATYAKLARKELRNNGGGTARDSLERGQRTILERLDAMDERLTNVENRRVRYSDATPPPPAAPGPVVVQIERPPADAATRPENPS